MSASLNTSRTRRSRQTKTVGVLGGMGPEAALEFCKRLMQRTPGVRREQDHLRVLLDNNAKIPDRTAALCGRGPSPAPEAIRSARALERAGARLIAIPCNTVHCWYGQIRRAVRAPVIHLIEVTVDAALKRARFSRRPIRIGVLATDGTLRARLYEQALNRRGAEALVPEARDQAAVMRAIHGIKLGRGVKTAEATVRRIGQKLVRRGASAVVLGCTEVSLALSDGDLSVPVVDSLDALVDETLRRAIVQRSPRRTA